MPNLTAYQFRQALCSLLGYRDDDDIWHSCSDEDPLQSDWNCIQQYCPTLAYSATVHVMPERIPIFADILRPRSSKLINILMDRGDDTVLVADSILPVKDALHLAVLLDADDTATDIIDGMNAKNMSVTIRPIDGQRKILLAGLRSFIFEGAC